MEKIVLEGKFLLEKEAGHTYLKQKLNLPEYYGRNLDALFDCLTECSEIEIEICLREERSIFLKNVISVFEDAAEENEKISLSIKA